MRLHSERERLDVVCPAVSVFMGNYGLRQPRPDRVPTSYLIAPLPCPFGFNLCRGKMGRAYKVEGGE
jgi:hypothetical protein